jgi:chemotaxis signal transduction protein
LDDALNNKLRDDRNPERALTEEAIAAAEAAVNESADEQSADHAAEAISVLAFRVRDSWFAIAAMAADEICERGKTFPLPRAPKHIPGVFNLHGRVVPLLDLQHFLQLSSGASSSAPILEHGTLTERIVVVSAHSVQAGLICDHVSGVLEITKEHWKEPQTELDEQHLAVAEALVEGPFGWATLLNVERLLERSRTRKQRT